MMIAGIVFIVAALAFGVLALRRLGACESFEEELAFGSAAGMLAGFFLLLAASLALGFTQATVIAVTAVLLFAAFLAARKHRPGLAHKKLISKRFIALAVVSAAFFGFLFSTHYLEPKEDGFYSGGSTWGDLAFHTAVTASMAYGDNFPPQNPEYSGTRLNYHFLIDFASAALIKTGFTLRDALILPSFLAGVLAVLCFFAFAKKIAGKNGALLAVAFVLLSGGLGFLYFAEDANCCKPAQTAVMEKQYAHLEDKQIFFSNFVADVFLPQRPALPGFAILFAALGMLVNALKGWDRKKLAAAGILAGMLPILHAHSFAAVMFAALVWAALDWKRWREWAWFFAPAIVLAIPQVFWIMPEGGAGFIRTAIGWMSPLNPLDLSSWIGFVKFWITNAGLAAIFVFPAWLAAGKETRWFYLPFAGLFVLANVFSFQPWQWDNIKLLVYWFAATAILVGAWFAAVLKRGHGTKVFAAVAVILMLSTGALSVYRESNLSWKLFGAEDIFLAEWAKENTAPRALFLSSDRHNSFLALAGRGQVMGYRGWLWSHGLNYSEREKDVTQMFFGGYWGQQLLQKYGVDYAVVGPEEQRDFAANPSFFSSNFELAEKATLRSVYKIK
jgi:hypothetical protein